MISHELHGMFYLCDVKCELTEPAYVEVRSTLNSTNDKQEEEEAKEVRDISNITSLTGDATTMLMEIKEMEVRLTASIKETHDKEMSDMEERLSSIISTTINDAVKGIQSSLNALVNNNLEIQEHSTEIVIVRNENTALNRQLQQLTAEQLKMKKQLVRIDAKKS